MKQLKKAVMLIWIIVSLSVIVGYSGSISMAYSGVSACLSSGKTSSDTTKAKPSNIVMIVMVTIWQTTCNGVYFWSLYNVGKQ